MIEKIEEALEKLKGMADEMSSTSSAYDYEYGLGILNAVRYIEGVINGK